MRSDIFIMVLLVLYINVLCASGNLGGSIALRADDGHFVCADGEDVVADRDEIREWEVFKLIDLGYGNIALQAHTGLYLCAEDGGGDDVVANRDEIGPWETFKLVNLGNRNVALQANNGQYVCAEDGGGDGVVADRDEIGSWETFKLIRNPKIGGEGERDASNLKTSSPMQKATLIIRDTVPSGARLWIWNGNEWIDSGKATPCSYNFNPDSNYYFDRNDNCKFKLTRSGYKDYSKKVKINGETKLGRINMEKK
jgi:hypothetical protein